MDKLQSQRAGFGQIDVFWNAPAGVADRQDGRVIGLARGIDFDLVAPSTGRACFSALEISSLVTSPQGIGALIGNGTSTVSMSSA
jgi:hypothetical protein